MASRKIKYRADADKSIEGALEVLDHYLSLGEKMETQRAAGEDMTYAALQAKASGGNLKQLVGMDKAITVRFVREGESVIGVEVGEAKWADKGATMVLAMFGAWPLAITSGYGIYQQSKLADKIKGVLDEYFGVPGIEEDRPGNPASGKVESIANSLLAKKDAVLRTIASSTQNAESVVGTTEWTCRDCGTSNHGRFCSECGAKKPESPLDSKWVCSNCGTENTGKFCSECGQKQP